MEVDVCGNLQSVRSTLPEGVKLVAVSKYHPNEYLQAAYDAGQRIFGESHEQELSVKQKTLPQDIEWHFIGHLQTNKVKRIAPYITMIHAVDSLKLLKEISKQAEKLGRTIDVLLQIHIAKEETKFGFSPDELREMLHSEAWKPLSNARICGLMMMASNVDDENIIRQEMMQASALFDEIKQNYFCHAPYFCERSWGMSHDYHIALECRSTMVRVGTAIFGPRVY